MQQRDFAIADEFVKENIPKGSKVIGEPMFYYSVIKAGSDYQYMDLYNTLQERERLLREVYNYDYLIVTDHIEWRKSQIPNYFRSHQKLELIDSLRIPKNSFAQYFTTSFLGKHISDVERKGYNCKLYRVKE
jgi:hypothetical protein